MRVTILLQCLPPQLHCPHHSQGSPPSEVPTNFQVPEGFPRTWCQETTPSRSPGSSEVGCRYPSSVPSLASKVGLLPEKLGPPLGGCWAKRQSSQTEGEGGMYYLQEIKITLGIFPKRVFAWQCACEGAQAGEIQHSIRAKVNRTQVLVDCSHKSEKATSPSLRFTGVGVFTTGVQQLRTILSTRSWCQAKGSARQNSPDARHKSSRSPVLLTD